MFQVASNYGDACKLATIARVVGDTTRARMLWSLMGGESRPAGELVLIAQVSSQTASNHLAQLRSAKLLTLQIRGRSHFYRLRNAFVAKALEAMMHVVNPGRPPVNGTVARVGGPGRLQLSICCCRGQILPCEYRMGAGAGASANPASCIPATKSSY